MDRFAREKRELSEQVHEVESQLEWLRSERDEEIAKLASEKKALQDRLHDAESQILQLKTRKRDELKVSVTASVALYIPNEVLLLSLHVNKCFSKGCISYVRE